MDILFKNISQAIKKATGKSSAKLHTPFFIGKEKLSEIVQSCGIPSKTENSIQTTLKNIAKEDSNAIIFCTGSLYFSGEILNLN